MARRLSADVNTKTAIAGAPVNGASASPETFSDRIIREGAKNGASLNEIAEALQSAGCGNPCTTTISRSAAYKEGRALNPKPPRCRPWAAQERQIVQDGARRGLRGPALRALLAEAGFQRGASQITASNYFRIGQRLALEDAAQVQADAEQVQPEATSAPAARTSQLIVRNAEFPRVSLPFVAIQKDWGEVIAR